MDANAQRLPLASTFSVPLVIAPKPLYWPMMLWFGVSVYGMDAMFAPLTGSSRVTVAVTVALLTFTRPMFV